MARAPLGLALCSFLLAGCGGGQIDLEELIAAQFPTIGRIDTGDLRHELESAVSVDITDAANDESSISVLEVELVATSLAEPSIGTTAVLTESTQTETGRRFTGELPPLPLGGYELAVRGRLQAGTDPSEASDLYLEEVRTVYVRESGTCFTFSSDVEGWTLAGIYDVQTSNAEPEGVADDQAEPVGCIGPAAINGAALVSLYDCLPAGEPESGYWALDLESPPLNELTDWQGIAGVAFGVSSSGNPDVELQPLLRTEDPAGTEHLFAPGAPGNRIFYPLEDGTVQWLIPQPPSSTTLETVVRAFVDPTTVFAPGTLLQLSAVCPITSL